jgi:hypothetical protein
MLLRVKKLEPDDFNRPRMKNVDTGSVYVDVSIGKNEWCASSRDGEPSFLLRDDVVFEIIEDKPNKR